MDESQKSNSHQKKVQLQARLAVNEHSAQLVKYWYPVLEVIAQSGIAWSLAYLDCVTGLKISCWQETLQQLPWHKHGIPQSAIREQDNYTIHDQIFATFPGTLPLRYLPSLTHSLDYPADMPVTILQKAVAELSLPEQMVYLFFTRLSPVLIIPLSGLLKVTDPALFPETEDICIAPVTGNWLIFRSLEDEWRYGYSG